MHTTSRHPRRLAGCLVAGGAAVTVLVAGTAGHLAEPLAPHGRAEIDAPGGGVVGSRSVVVTGPGDEEGSDTVNELTTAVLSATPVSLSAPGIITVEVHNTSDHDLRIGEASGTISAISGGERDDVPRCDPSWFSIGAPAAAVDLPSGATSLVRLTVSMRNDPTINQDNCQGATYHFDYAVRGSSA